MRSGKSVAKLLAISRHAPITKVRAGFLWNFEAFCQILICSLETILQSQYQLSLAIAISFNRQPRLRNRVDLVRKLMGPMRVSINVAPLESEARNPFRVFMS